MAKQVINIGISSNDGTGDPLRDAMDKVNDNFTELYDRNEFDGQYSSLTGAPTIPTNLGDLSNVQSATPTYDNQVLTWDADTSAWIAANNTLLTGYTDGAVDLHLNTGTATTGQVLSWTGTDYDWVAQGGGGSTTFAGLTEINLADLDVHDIGLQARTKYTVSANGSTAYRFDIHGTTDNPTIYATAGDTIAFDLTGLGGSHPFQIETNGGAAYNTGLIHYAEDGTRTTDTNAQAKTAGTLYWKIPAGISGTYEYQCTAHAAMNGNIEIVDPSASGGGGGSSLQTRTTKIGTATSLANNTTANIAIDGFKAFGLMKIETSHAAWVRLYIDAASRTADAGRAETSDPAPDAGVIAEVITTGAETVNLSPGVMGWLTSGTSISAAVTNKSGSTNNVVVTLTVLQLEA